jgi:PIN domain nuclease of toxin-antitoxin system
VILLDTHAIIWMLIGPDQLSRRAREAILQTRMKGERITCSSVSFFEIAYLSFRERLELHASREDFLAEVQARIEVIPVGAQIAICAGELPVPFHGDPMDRIITATAIVECCTLITKDEKIRDAKLCKVIW